MKIKIKSARKIMLTLREAKIDYEVVRCTSPVFAFAMFDLCGNTFSTDISKGGKCRAGGWTWKPEWYDVVVSEDTPPEGYRIVPIDERLQHDYPHGVNVTWWDTSSESWMSSYGKTGWDDEDFTFAIDVDHEWQVKEMTVAEVAKELGYEVKIIRS